VSRILDDRSLDSVFRAARSCRGWLDRPVSEAMIGALWELAKLPPTSTRGHPARILFLRSRESRVHLAAAVAPGDRAATIAAPVTAIIGHAPATVTAADLRDATLQGAYLILAARALGLDCTPLTLVDTATVDREFFADGWALADFACNLGYGDPNTAEAAKDGPSFEEACRVL
jgi:3-hydroxypropanoate dehydrogenase